MIIPNSRLRIFKSFIHLIPDMSTILSIIIHLSTQTCKTMFHYDVRWAFGLHPPIDKEEATIDTMPLLQAEGSDCTKVLASNDGDNTRSYPQAMHIDYEEATLDLTPTTTPPRHVSFVDTELPNIPTLSLSRYIPHQRFVFESFKESKLYPDWPLSNKAVSQADDNTPEMSVLPLLEPVRDDLVRLKALTPESLPSYNPRLRTQHYAQILKHRLLPIGQFIVSKLDQIAEDKRGALELHLCRYIASNHWPLSTDEYTHLRIHEMYRNSLYMSAQHTSTSQAPELCVGSLLEQHLAQPMSNAIPGSDRLNQITTTSDPDPNE